ncbi:MAG: hypothetical protein CML16_04700 [Pusillimonas sp.]|nr:hypothetical protein [Pusillimonas sp.]MBC44014.1 hypothetical protein [Pusillimonas sp.]HCN72339.1 DUF2946 domain-containing protein [Pusillimonas sp.]HCP78755.1 DUF2946 domain-containing protein [Pusillimonas sp.]|tara:strand:- start:50405 stop:51019 length:615 start_codon:yes stop_codon:yes gene_type:complete
MDKRVLEAMARWPNVPDAFGWLSLTETGKWRLHPKGDATQADTPGESITNAQIVGFINRNYTRGDNGQWYFQNGPQKVYVRLDAAPYVFHTNETGALATHTQQTIQDIQAWWLDDAGKLYAQTEHGPGLICGRDTLAVLEQLRTADDQPLVDCPERIPQDTTTTLLLSNQAQSTGKSTVPLRYCPAHRLEAQLGFVRLPALGYA